MTLRSFVTTKLGVDKAIFFTLWGRGLQIGTALFTVLFVARFLSPEEQGYYYTFSSIIAIQVFFELGLTGVITQFVAHEVSHLHFDGYKLSGDKQYMSRLSSLLRFCAKWYLVFSILLLVVLAIVGYVFFTRYQKEDDGVVWALPWLLLAIGTAFNLLLSPVLAFIEGLGKVKEVAEIQLVQQFVHPVCIWGGLAIGSKLFVAGADAVVRVLVVVIILIKSPFYRLLKDIWKGQQEERVSYMKEVFPYQWRIALSWISGYFIFQLFNPVLFASEGAIVAGQMGMTISALNGVQALALSWIKTKVPTMSMYIAQKEYKQLDILFYRTFKQMMLVGTFTLLLFIIVIFAIQYYNISPFGLEIGNRFLPFIPLCLMTWSVFTMMPINSWATYLRCHKKEPLLINSIVMGILCCLSTYFFGIYFGLMGMTIGFALLRIVSLVWIFSVFKKKKYEWHEQ